MRYLTTDDVIRFNELLVGPGKLADFGLLESAVLRPQSSAFGEDAYSDVHIKGAALEVVWLALDGSACRDRVTDGVHRIDVYRGDRSSRLTRRPHRAREYTRAGARFIHRTSEAICLGRRSANSFR